MSRVRWKDYLEGKYKPVPPGTRRQLGPQRWERTHGVRRQLNCRIRERARECMTELTSIVDHMENITDEPEREFSKIFTKDVYTSMRDAVFLAHELGLIYGQNDLDAFQVAEISIALTQAGLAHKHGKLYTKSYRDKMNKLLREKQQKTPAPALSSPDPGPGV